MNAYNTWQKRVGVELNQRHQQHNQRQLYTIYRTANGQATITTTTVAVAVAATTAATREKKRAARFSYVIYYTDGFALVLKLFSFLTRHNIPFTQISITLPVLLIIKAVPTAAAVYSLIYAMKTNRISASNIGLLMLLRMIGRLFERISLF